MRENLQWIRQPNPGEKYRDGITGLFERDQFLLELDREFLLEMILRWAISA